MKSKMKTRKHKRGGKNKFKKRNSSKTSSLQVNFLNIRGLSGKVHELNQHLTNEKISVFGLAETFLKDDNRPPNLDKDYSWIGKSRKGAKSKGGLGLCISHDVTILDENLLGSKTDSFERLWSLVRLNNSKTAIGVSYFPNDGLKKEKTDSLFYELLENVTNFNNMGYDIILMGDFNGRCVDICPFTAKTIIKKTSSSFNGDRLLRFAEASDLSFVNTLNCCDGFFTRILNNQRSAIDYMLMSKELIDSVDYALIDEDGKYNLHSDHVIISVKMSNKNINAKPPEVNPVLKWKINETTDWSYFQQCLRNEFENGFDNVFSNTNDINEIWEVWKSDVKKAASKAVGKQTKVKNYRDFWDSELDGLIKKRKIANRLKRAHDKSRPHDSETGKLFSELYKTRKKAVQEAIQRKIQAQKLVTFNRKCCSSKNRAKGFWEMLKEKNQSVNPSYIIDPVDKTSIIEGKGKIETHLKTHFSEIGSDNLVSANNKMFVNNFLNDIMVNNINSMNMFSLEVKRSSVEKILSDLKSGKACGPDVYQTNF